MLDRSAWSLDCGGGFVLELRHGILSHRASDVVRAALVGARDPCRRCVTRTSGCMEDEHSLLMRGDGTVRFAC